MAETGRDRLRSVGRWGTFIRSRPVCDYGGCVFLVIQVLRPRLSATVFAAVNGGRCRNLKAMLVGVDSDVIKPGHYAA